MSNNSHKHKRSGFTLLEVILVVGIIAIVGVAGLAFYRNFAKGNALEMAAKTIISDLVNARAKAMAGEDGVKWGIHFVNGVDDYYELFSTPSDYSSPSKQIVETKYLPGQIVFTNPGEGSGPNTVSLNWTNSPDADFSNVVILRSISTISDAPAEGSSPNINDVIGSSIVRCISSGISFTDTGLTSGTPYYYKIFSRDTNGNYDIGVAAGPFTPD